MTLVSVAFLTEQKEKLSEVEQQLKKAEAAQRRRMQVEKAAKESEVWLPSIYLVFYFFGLAKEFYLTFLCVCLLFSDVRKKQSERSWVKIRVGRNEKTRLRNVKKISHR